MKTEEVANNPFALISEYIEDSEGGHEIYGDGSNAKVLWTGKYSFSIVRPDGEVFEITVVKKMK